MKISGIYKIESKINPRKIYIGSASNINNRWNRHLSDLRLNRHWNKKLQNHYNKYGESDLMFFILIGCEKEDLLKNEQFYIDAYNPWFNNCRIAGKPIGIKHSIESCKNMSKSKMGHFVSEETKRKISESHKGIKHTEERKQKNSKSHIGLQAGNKHPLYGKHHSEETKRKIGKGNRGKIVSMESRMKMSIFRKGRTSGSKGKTWKWKKNIKVA
jgi:hypothetical protein